MHMQSIVIATTDIREFLTVGVEFTDAVLANCTTQVFLTGRSTK